MKVLPTKCDEQLPRIVKIIVCGFRIIGLAPFSVKRTRRSTRNSRDSLYTSEFVFSKMGLAYNIVLSILVLVIGGFAIPQLSSMIYANKSSITQAIDVTQGILRTSTSCVIIASWGLRQEKSISIMNRLLKIDGLLSGMKENPRSQRILMILLTVQMILSGLLWGTFWASEESYIKSFLHGFIVNVPIFVIHWFIVEYSIVLVFVARELTSLNKTLSNFEEYPKRLLRTPLLNDYHPPMSLPTHCNQLAVLELFHYIYTTIFEVCEDIADLFSLPTLLSVACFSVALVYNIYYLVIPIVISASDFNLSTNINAITWILVSAYPLILLPFSVTETLKEAKLTGVILHKVFSRTTKSDIQKEIERFSLQLMHEDLSFTACGFFPLDFTLIQSIFGTTATYLVIVIQFMQSALHTSKKTQS